MICNISYKTNTIEKAWSNTKPYLLLSCEETRNEKNSYEHDKIKALIILFKI